MNVTKLGVAYRGFAGVTLRAGWNHGSNPIRSQDFTSNMLPPGVVQDQATLGFTVDLGQASEITGAPMVAPRKSVGGSSLFNSVLGAGAGGNERMSTRQQSFGLAWAQKF